jgi:hypothetical protein
MKWLSPAGIIHAAKTSRTNQMAYFMALSLGGPFVRTFCLGEDYAPCANKVNAVRHAHGRA